MKKFTISLVSLQLLLLVFITYTGIQLFKAEQTIHTTQAKLSNTIVMMDDIYATQEEEKEWNRPLKEGGKAPVFVALNEKQEQVKLADYKGKKVLLVFSQEGCNHCEEFYPVINNFKKQEEDVEVLVLSINSYAEDNEAYRIKQNIEVPVLAVTDEDADNYKIRRTPTSILIDEEGNFAGAGIFEELSELQQFVNQDKSNANDTQNLVSLH